MPNVITREEAKARLGITDTGKDAHIDTLLPGIGRLIERHTHREFTLNSAGAASDRTYWYDGAGVLEIGDCESVTAVALDARTLNPDEYIVGPQDQLEPVFHYLELISLRLMSPEMGFTYNLDRLWPSLQAGRRRLRITVTANWGWPTVPEDIKLAAAWLLAEGLDRTRASGVTAESIAEYSVSFAQGATMQGALPDRVLDILEDYRRVNV